MNSFKSILIIAYLLLFIQACSGDGKKNTGQKSISEIVAAKQAIALKNAYDAVQEAKQKIKNGDLICRTGYDNISLSLQNFNTKDKSYSHSGLAFIENGEIMIYHSIAGSEENPNENFLREPFDSFVNPLRKAGFGIFRYDLSDGELKNLTTGFKQLYIKHVKFDKNFNLKDDDKQYCSEAIYKCLKKATNNRVLLPTTIKKNYKSNFSKYVNPNSKDFEYVALDNLYLNDFCKPIFKIKYTTNPPTK